MKTNQKVSTNRELISIRCKSDSVIWNLRNNQLNNVDTGYRSQLKIKVCLRV